MADEPENHTIRFLQEMREEMRAEFGRIRADMSSVRGEMTEEFAHVNLRIDGLTHIITLLAGRSHDHEDRIAKLEGDRT